MAGDEVLWGGGGVCGAKMEDGHPIQPKVYYSTQLG